MLFISFVYFTSKLNKENIGADRVLAVFTMQCWCVMLLHQNLDVDKISNTLYLSDVQYDLIIICHQENIVSLFCVLVFNFYVYRQFSLINNEGTIHQRQKDNNVNNLMKIPSEKMRRGFYNTSYQNKKMGLTELAFFGYMFKIKRFPIIPLIFLIYELSSLKWPSWKQYFLYTSIWNLF